MTEPSFVLAPLYKGWDGYQQHLVKALVPLSPEQLALQATPHLRSIGMLATHLVRVRATWFYYVLSEGGEQLISIDKWEDSDQPARSASELVGGLQTTWNVIDDALHRWTFADLEETLRGEEGIYTRQWVIWHLLEHDLHHGGELSFSLGMHGLAAIDL
jgi:uncharacterized damage-inducible protein DinB